MTNEEALIVLKEMRKRDCDRNCDYSCILYNSRDKFCKEFKALDMAIKALETHKEPQFLKLYSYLNDMRLAISPDELTLASKRKERQIKADLLGKILDHMNKMLEPDMRGERDITIKALEQQSKWIPCEERLPEKDVNVLTYHRNVSFDYQYVSWIDDYSGKWAGFIGNLPDDVIAWMPLPEAYKKSEE